jgi:imidazole glycerol-phosphate synthase subunit HisF
MCPVAIPRVIPALLFRGRGLVKTVRFADPTYVGDPVNVIRIFNDKEVDEILLLDITASRERRGPDFGLIEEVSSECFMPLGYGGGINSVETMARLFALGVEKVVVNHALSTETGMTLLRQGSERFGSQSIVASIDASRRPLLGGYRVYDHVKACRGKQEVKALAVEAQAAGAGEIFLNVVDRDGTMTGYELPLIEQVSRAVDIPVIACGGAAVDSDFRAAVDAGASAVAAGAKFVFQGRHRAVLVNFPERDTLARVFKEG